MKFSSAFSTLPTKPLGFAALVTSLLILFLNAYGIINPVNLAESSLNQRGIPGFNFPTIPNERLARFRDIKIETPTYKFVVEINSLVFKSIYHFSEYRSYNIFENWFLWFAGKTIYKQLDGIQDVDYIISGRGAWCGQVAQVVMSALEVSGIPSRFLGLSGHVVLEVNLDGKWIVVDPDYGVIFPVGLESLEMPENAHRIISALSERGYSQKVIETYLNILQSKEDNTTLPVGSKLNPRLYIAEVIGAWIKWIVPTFLLMLAFALLRMKSGS